MTPRRPRGRGTGALVALALAAGACSGGGGHPKASPSGSPAATSAACQVVSASEVRAALGLAPANPTPGADRCTWSAPDGAGFLTVVLDRQDQPAAALEASRVSDGGDKVDGIGDNAYVALPADQLGIVAFVHGPTEVSILLRSPDRSRDALLNLARSIAGRV